MARPLCAAGSATYCVLGQKNDPIPDRVSQMQSLGGIIYLPSLFLGQHTQYSPSHPAWQGNCSKGSRSLPGTRGAAPQGNLGRQPSAVLVCLARSGSACLVPQRHNAELLARRAPRAIGTLFRQKPCQHLIKTKKGILTSFYYCAHMLIQCCSQVPPRSGRGV